MKALINFHKTNLILICLVSFYSFTIKAQTPVKIKLIGIFWDSAQGYTYDTLYFGFHKDGAKGYQPGLDVLDTSLSQNWGTYDTSTPNLRYKTNIREFVSFSFTNFYIYGRGSLRFIKWVRKEYDPAYYDFDFKRISIGLEASGIIFRWPEQDWFGITDSWIDSTPVIFTGGSAKLWATLGVRDSIPSSLNERKVTSNLDFTYLSSTNEVFIANPHLEALAIRITNAIGQQVYEANLNTSSNFTHTLPSLPTGVYNLSIYSERVKRTKPILIH